MDDDSLDELEKELNAPNDDEWKPDNNEWTEEKYQQRMDKVASASANLGTLLLKGWTMLAEECPKCHSPLMKLRDGAPQCVVCTPINEKPKVQKKSKTIVVNKPTKMEKSKPRKSEKANACNTNKTIEMNDDQLWKDALFESRMKQADDSSSKIGELLLKGWTMLADHCRKCQTPLMSLRGGNPMCCLCDPKAKSTQNGQKKNMDKVKKNRNSLNTIIEERRKKTADKQRINSLPKPKIQSFGNGQNGMNGFDGHANEKKNDEPIGYGAIHNGSYNRPARPSPMSVSTGFSANHSERIEDTLGDSVNIVLDKMSAINKRMAQSKGSLKSDLEEINDLLWFLRYVNEFKKGL